MRIGVHLYRRRTLYRNYQGRWRRARAYWDLWKHNRYYKRPRWFWGRYRRVGCHLYRLRIYKRWIGGSWVVVRRYWHLWRKNHYNHRFHGRQQWRWTNSYRRIGVHRYRYRVLYRNYQGYWKRFPQVNYSPAGRGVQCLGLCPIIKRLQSLIRQSLPLAVVYLLKKLFCIFAQL